MRYPLDVIGAALITGIAVSVFSATLVHAAWYAPEAELTLPPAAPAAGGSVVPSSEYPARLIIPSLNVNASVQYVGIAASGHMAVPDNFTDVAWYRNGPAPGQPGNAVIDGHVDNGLGLAGVFKHLNDIKAGDDIYVETKAGNKLHFVVTDTELYPYESVPTTQIFHSSDRAAHLTLITCDGAWVEGQRTYDHRLVVYTKLVS